MSSKSSPSVIFSAAAAVSEAEARAIRSVEAVRETLRHTRAELERMAGLVARVSERKKEFDQLAQNLTAISVDAATALTVGGPVLPARLLAVEAMVDVARRSLLGARTLGLEAQAARHSVGEALKAVDASSRAVDAITPELRALLAGATVVDPVEPETVERQDIRVARHEPDAIQLSWPSVAATRGRPKN